MTTTRSRHRSRGAQRMLAATGALVIACTLAACTSGGASTGDAASVPTTGPAGKASGTLTQQVAKYAADIGRCLAAAGFEDGPDPDDPAQGAAWADANGACVDELGEAPGAIDGDDPAVTAADSAQRAAWGMCLTARGFEVPPGQEPKPLALWTPEGMSDAEAEQCQAKADVAWEAEYDRMSGH
jgi:hypothetical protein